MTFCGRISLMVYEYAVFYLGLVAFGLARLVITSYGGAVPVIIAQHRKSVGPDHDHDGVSPGVGASRQDDGVGRW